MQIMRKILTLFVGLVLTVLLPFSQFSPAIAHADWDVDDQHQLVPMYVYPNWWVSGNDWTRICENSNAGDIGSTMIANVNNGPGSSRNTDYAQIIEVCHDNGHNVIGYVDTSYGAVPLATVKADIDAWYDYYDGNNTGVYDLGETGMDTQVDGIFIDQMANFPSVTANSTDNITVGEYYREIFEYIKNVAPGDYDAVIGNPGVGAPTDWQLNDIGQNPTQAADELVVFEGPPTGTLGLSNYVMPEWVEEYPASDIVMLVHSADIEDVPAICETLKDNNAGLVFVTPFEITETSTPWNFVPSSTYWDEFRSECG